MDSGATKGNNGIQRDESRRNAVTPALSAIGYDRAAGKPDKEPAMAQFEDDREGPVVVRRAAYDAGMKLEADVKAETGPAFETARDKAAECRAAGRANDAALWHEVYQFLMTRESVGAEAETIILEEGETYDYDEGEVRRPASGLEPKDEEKEGESDGRRTTNEPSAP
jgi:hypothetical protein